jgi:hypothetical protein
MDKLSLIHFYSEEELISIDNQAYRILFDVTISKKTQGVLKDVRENIRVFLNDYDNPTDQNFKSIDDYKFWHQHYYHPLEYNLEFIFIQPLFISILIFDLSTNSKNADQIYHRLKTFINYNFLRDVFDSYYSDIIRKAEKLAIQLKGHGNSPMCMEMYKHPSYSSKGTNGKTSMIYLIEPENEPLLDAIRHCFEFYIKDERQIDYLIELLSFGQSSKKIHLNLYANEFIGFLKYLKMNKQLSEEILNSHAFRLKCFRCLTFKKDVSLSTLEGYLSRNYQDLNRSKNNDFQIVNHFINYKKVN